MALKETIETEYKNALKAKDKTKISTYRLILSSIKDLTSALLIPLSFPVTKKVLSFSNPFFLFEPTD